VTWVYVILSLIAALGLDNTAYDHTTYKNHMLSALDRLHGQLESLDSDVPDFGLTLASHFLPIRGVTPPTFSEDPDGKQITALLVALLQYPVHMYSVFALRAANESRLTQGNTEQDWGFGQVVAVILLGNNVVLLAEGILRTYTVACGSAFSCGLTD
jgi:hypothetical protein